MIICSCSVIQLCPTLCHPMDCRTPAFPVLHLLLEFALKLMFIESVMLSSHIILCQPLLPFSSCLRSFPESGSFQMSQLFASGGQSIGVSASSSVLSMNIQVYFPLGWTGWISLQSKGLPRVFSNTNSSKASIFWHSAFFIIQISHPYMTTGKTIALTRWTFVGKEVCLLFNMLSRLVVDFLPRSKHLLISWLQSPSAVILEPTKVNSANFHCFAIYLP